MAADTPSSLAAVYLCACVRGPCDLMLVIFAYAIVYTHHNLIYRWHVLSYALVHSRHAHASILNHQYHLLHTVHVHTQVYTGLDIGSDKVRLSAYFCLVYCTVHQSNTQLFAQVTSISCKLVYYGSAVLHHLMQPVTSRRPC
jgi:hypothetical protein